MRELEDFESQAARCRRLAEQIDDPSVRCTLAELADYYERLAAATAPPGARTFEDDKGD
jgi:hypothetical protein